MENPADCQMNLTNSTATDPCNPHLSQAPRAVLGTALVLITVMGTVGNSILSIYVIRNTEMQSLINILLATMAVSDTLLSLLCTPFDLLTIISGTWVFGEGMCFAHSFTLSVLVVLNVTLLVVISVDRYYILVHKRDRLRKCHVGMLISACAVFSVAVSSPPLFDGGKLVFANVYCRQMCKGTDHVYSLLFSGFLFMLPCSLLLLAYVHIMVIIRKTTRRVRPHLNHRLSGNDHERSLKINVQFKQKTFSTILCLYAAAVVCKLPLAVSVLLKSLSLNVECPVANWIMLLTYLNSAINPFIYALKINEYLLMLTGKFDTVKNQVKGFKSGRSRSQPQNIYVVTVDSTSVL